MDELPITLRPMTPEDADEVAYVARRLPDYFHEGGVKHIGRAVLDRPGLVAVYGGQVAGFVIYESRSPIVEIMWMGVLPFYQGRGVGWRMIEHLIGQVLATGQPVTTIEARTLAASEEHPGYERTRAFYEGIGFQLAGVEKGHFHDGSDAALYRLDISNGH